MGTARFYFGRKLLTWHVETLSHFLTVFLEAEGQVKVDNLELALKLVFLLSSTNFHRYIFHAYVPVNDPTLMKLFYRLT